MMGGTFRVIPGSYQAWFDDDDIYSAVTLARYFSIADDETYLGSFDHEPTASEIAEAVKVVKE